MSRFWGRDSDESESEEENIEEPSAGSGSEDEESDNEQAPQTARKALFDRYDSDEEEANEKRVVRSQKQKKYEAFEECVKKIQNSIRNNDWVSISNEYDNLNKILIKAQQLIEREGYPRVFIRGFAELEDAAEAAWANKEAQAKMNANNKKCLSTVRQRVRKQKSTYEADLTKYRANPEAFNAEEEEEKEVEEEEEETEEEEEEEEDNEGFTKTERKKKNAKKAAKAEEAAEQGEFVPENVERKLMEVISVRGKKNTDIKKQIEILRKLIPIADNTPLVVRVMMTLVGYHLDQTLSMTQYLSPEVWKSAVTEYRILLATLDANPTIVVREDVMDELSDDEEVEETKKEGEEGEEDDEAEPVVVFKKAKANKPRHRVVAAENPNFQYVTGSLVSIVERLDDEFTKSLQNIDPHTTEYLDRLRDETQLYEMIVRTQKYYERIDRVDPLCRAILRRVEHIYFKNTAVNDALETAVGKLLDPNSAPTTDTTALLHKLCTHLYKHANERIRTRALLCHVYHHALHDRFYAARDMLLMSHLQETIQHTDINTQILYNRAMVQIGLCAFRHGLIKEAHLALQEIESSGRIKELLAQGVVSQRHSEKNPEQEKLEKQRQVPFHMHINLELLECVYLTCSLCLEVPILASYNFESRKRMISKPFRRVLDYIDRQQFSGPPENTREHIMQASKALMQGDWETSVRLVNSIKIWDLMPNKPKVLENVERRLRDEGLRTYLFTFSQYYDSLSLEHLANMFKITPTAVRGIISKMIINEEIHASLDQLSGVVILHRTQANKLEYLAIQYAEKLASLVEANEKMFDLRSGNTKEERRDKRGGGSGGGRGGYQGQRDNYSRGSYQERRNYGDRENRGGYRGGDRGDRGDRSGDGENRGYRGGDRGDRGDGENRGYRGDGENRGYRGGDRNDRGDGENRGYRGGGDRNDRENRPRRY